MLTLDYEKYRQIYERISRCEEKIDEYNTRRYYPEKDHFVSQEQWLETMQERAVNHQVVCEDLRRAEEELRKLIAKDFGHLGLDVVRPGTLLRADVDYGDHVFEDHFKVSAGHLLAEDRQIQEMYGSGIQLVTPYDLIGRNLMGLKLGDRFTYKLQSFTYNGVITKVF